MTSVAVVGLAGLWAGAARGQDGHRGDGEVDAGSGAASADAGLPAASDAGEDAATDAGEDATFDAGDDAAPDAGGSAAAGDADVPAEPLSTEVDVSLGLPDDERWVFVDKSERRLVVNNGQGVREAFRVALGFHPEGDKTVEGDGRTPEGEFYVCRRIKHNRFHRFLGLSYPGPADAQRGQKRRVLQPIEYRAIMRAHRRRTVPPWRTPLGGNVGIHGYGRRNERAARHAAGEDWTDGCIAVDNDEIERIFNQVRLGTRVVIVP